MTSDREHARAAYDAAQKRYGEACKAFDLRVVDLPETREKNAARNAFSAAEDGLFTASGEQSVLGQCELCGRTLVEDEGYYVTTEDGVDGHHACNDWIAWAQTPEALQDKCAVCPHLKAKMEREGRA